MGLKLSQQGEKTIDSLRNELGWNRQDDRWCQSAHTTIPTLKRFLAAKVPIDKNTFISICRAVGACWREVVDIESASTADVDPPFKYWDRAPHVPTFHGRDSELDELVQSIATRHRIVALHGIAGIGKTALAVKLAERVQLQFNYLIWYPLRDAPSLEKVLTDLLEFLYRNSNSNPPRNIQNISDLLSELMKFFRDYRCLLVLDNYEAILRSGDYAGEYREGYRSYYELIRCMGEERHESCLIVTSREIPRDIDILKTRNLQVHLHELKGLEEAGREILREKGLFQEIYWKKLIDIYRGNPLLLQIIAAHIKDSYNGEVGVFIKRKTTLTLNIQNVVWEVIERLSDIETSILRELARQKESVSLPQLQECFSFSPSELSRAIESLTKRSLIEKSAADFTLQPVVKEYMTDS